MVLRVSGDTLFTLYFADGQNVLAEDDDEFEYMFRKFHEEYTAAELSTNIAICEYLMAGRQQIKDLLLDHRSDKRSEKK